MFDDWLTGYGTVSGALSGHATVVSGSGTGVTLKIEGSLASFVGDFWVASNSTLELGSGTSRSVTFSTSDTQPATLKLDAPATFTGSINNVAIGNTIDLVGINVSDAIYSGTTLTINETNGQHLTYNVHGDIGVAVLTLASDDNGGTDIYWVTPLTESLAQDTGTSSNDKITSIATLTGSGIRAAVVHLTIDGIPLANTVRADFGGTWTYTPTSLSDGTHTIVASETDAAGHTSNASLTFTLDTTAPTITISQKLANDTGSSSSDLTTKDGHVTVSATVTDDHGVSGVEVFDGTTDLGEASIVSGTWSFSTLLGEGSHALSAVATDLAGNATTTSAQPTILVDMTAPVPVMLNAIFDKSLGLTKLSGLSEAGRDVSVFDAGKLVGTTKAADDGTWSLLTQVKAKTVHSYSESATDLAGNAGFSLGVALYSPGSNKTLTGGIGNDVLIANNNDTLTGGGGSDTFVFNPGFGKVTATDFNVNQDILAFDHSLFSDPTASQVLSQAHDTATGMVIAVDRATTVTLVGVHVADLQAHPYDIHFF